MTTEEFSSEGYDLDAIPSNPASNEGDGIVYEVGGGASTRQQPPTEPKVTSTISEEKDSVISKSEELKQKGNEQFKAGNHLDAYDYYTDAIDACPGMKGSEMLEMREKHNEEEREKAYQMNRRKEHTRAKMPDSEEVSNESPKDDKDGETSDKNYVPVEFEIPNHEYGKHLAVYHSNRAACLLHLGRYEDAIKDCDIALFVNPKYSKAYIRRMTAYEKTERTEEALKDAKSAQEIDPKKKDVQNHVRRLQKIEDERIEKLKEETMGKLKDLGNSILGNFGMSLDNFKANKDPNTGSYNISFQN